MTPEDTKRLLAKAALIDSRTVDLATIAAWHEAIGHLDARDAMAALTIHRQRDTQYLLPAHIVRYATEARRARETAEARERARHWLPPAPAKPIPAWVREQVARIGKGA